MYSFNYIVETNLRSRAIIKIILRNAACKSPNMQNELTAAMSSVVAESNKQKLKYLGIQSKLIALWSTLEQKHFS